MSAPEIQTTISPHNQRPLVSRTYPSEAELDATIKRAAAAQRQWGRVPLQERIAIGRKFRVRRPHRRPFRCVLDSLCTQDELAAMTSEISTELSQQMGRCVLRSRIPAALLTGVAGPCRRSRERCGEPTIAHSTCSTSQRRASQTCRSQTQTSPVSNASSAARRSASCSSSCPGSASPSAPGPVAVAQRGRLPCSYPYLVSINTVLPALIAGNAVLLKPSPQTPLAAERFALALTRAGVPADAVQVVHLSPALTVAAARHPLVDFVSFTGSVAGGKVVEKAAVDAPGYKGVALEVCCAVLGCGLRGLTELFSWEERTRRMFVLMPIWISPCPNWLMVRTSPPQMRAANRSDHTGAIFNSGQSCCAVEVYPLFSTTFYGSLTSETAHLRTRVSLRCIRLEIRGACEGILPLVSGERHTAKLSGASNTS